MAKDPVEQVLKTARSYELIAPGDRVMLAVSGGPDSMFMMHALTRFKKKLSIKELSVCNLDHGLRGGESARDSKFVKDACRRYGLKCLHRKISLKLAAKNGLSTEEAAREARYRFFSD